MVRSTICVASPRSETAARTSDDIESVKRIRIAFVSSTLDVGGAENVLSSLMTRLPRERYDTELLFLKNPGTVGKRLIRHGVAHASGLQRGRRDPAVLFRLVSRLRSSSPDILFSLDHHNAMFWGRLASLVARVPRRVVASHSTGRMESRRSFSRLDRFLMRYTDAVVALSAAHADYLQSVEGIDPQRIVVIENGIDVERYERVDSEAVDKLREEFGLGSEDRVVTMVAALRPEKAHGAFLAAAADLVGHRPDLRTRFLVVGDGPERARIETRRSELGLEDRVALLGERDDIPEILGLSGVLVLPSHGAVETLPLAVLEAMAAGVPVVASAVGSVPEIIEEGRTGRLIAPADPVGLSGAICRTFDEREGTQRITREARETVRKRYAVERMVARYEELFDRLTGTG
jgi:glycosyltransferase involved in cell wall biosynthesis